MVEPAYSRGTHVLYNVNSEHETETISKHRVDEYRWRFGGTSFCVGHDKCGENEVKEDILTNKIGAPSEEENRLKCRKLLENMILSEEENR